MPRHNGFFSNINNSWDEYSPLRKKYADAIPLPQNSYFKPIRSIDEMATLATRPFEKPLWLGFHTLGFIIKALLNLAISIVLAPCALALTLVAPNSELCATTSSSFKLAASETVVASGMAALAFCSTVLALIFNPLHVITRVASTVIDSVSSSLDDCCGLTCR